MEITVKQRIIEFMRVNGIKPATFERMCGLSNGYLNQLRNSPSLSKIDKICEAFPKLSRNWLITGDGDMILDENSNENQAQTQFRNTPNNDLVSALQNHIADLQAERDRLLDEIERLRSVINAETKKGIA